MDEKVKLISIPFEKLHQSPLNTYQIVEIDDLKQSLRTYGLLTALSVIGPMDDGTYSILSGNRRYKAIEELRKEGSAEYAYVPCYVLGNKDMNETIQQLMIEASNQDVRSEDAASRERHRLNIVRLVKKLADDGEIDSKNMVEEAGKYMRMSERYRKIYFQLYNNGTEHLQDYVAGGNLGPLDAVKISRMDPELQDQAVDELSQAQTTSEKKDIMEKYHDEYTPQKPKKPSKKMKVDIDDLDWDNLDSFGFEDDYSNDELNIDTTGRLSSMRADEMKSAEEKQEITLETVTEWGEQILQKDDLSSKEWDVVALMKKVVDKFC